jgi:hypothetical protein
MDMYPGYVVKRNVATIRMDTGVKQQPFDCAQDRPKVTNPSIYGTG